ncbi:hypothetical protein MSUIS_06150 [Mycoplasma suis KI3806]|uniref:Uncharacterized protein n=1 Tax=Mycoplasma suis (strain KI_3806) TaxID=708248 RepID=F0V227_MYCS3|nr:hypothetical protein [Mycoplasma suis]CBZ40708.1 hypothetical protein MSUIS_06150 [Mycoplasma suis KI3806]
MPSLSLLTKVAAGIVLAGSVGGGLTYGGYEFKKRFMDESISELAKTSEYSWEYFLISGKDKKECGKLEDEEGKVVECVTPWAKKVSSENIKKEIGWWMIGDMEKVDLFLKSWETFKGENTYKWKTKEGISSLKKDKENKCHIKEDLKFKKVEIFCE